MCGGNGEDGNQWARKRCPRESGGREGRENVASLSDAEDEGAKGRKLPQICDRNEQ